MSLVNGDLGILSVGGNAGFQLVQSIASMLEGKFVMDREQWIASMKALKGQAAAFMVFQILLDRCFGERTFSWYKRKNLCDLLGITERALQKALSTLEEQRMALRIQGYRPSGTKTSNLYIVNTMWPVVPDWWPTDPQADYHPSVVRALLSAFTHRCVNELPNGDRLVQLVINQANDYPGPIIRVKAEDYPFTTDRNSGSGRSDQGISVTRTSETPEKPVTIDRNYSSGQTGTTVPVGPEPQFRTRINQNIEKDKEQNEIKRLNNNNVQTVDVVVDVLQRYGISVNKKTLTKWRKLADEQTIVRVVHETMNRDDVRNVVGYVTSILEAGYTPAVPSKGQTEGAGLTAAGADTVPAVQKAAATVTSEMEVAAAAAREVATSVDTQLALDLPSDSSTFDGGRKWITFEDLTEFLNVRPHQHYRYVRFLAEVNEYIDFEGMDYDCVRYAFEIVQKRMKETRENIYYSHRVVLNILSEWANNGVRTKEEAIKYEEARRTRVSVRARTSEHATEQDKPLAHAVQHQIEMEKAGLYQEREERKIAEDPELMALLMELEKRKNR